ncbi:MAG: four-carbon acid sugar kinase family protein, partial [Dehalococcoidales bacterium]|nr:four-carbon acid sugar kinase family protein [Dehalococcoidales bacterium]
MASTLGIIADDLTGAMDSGGYFAVLGWGTVVVINSSYRSLAAVTVLNTSSRADAADIAYQKVHRAVKALSGRTIYKKVDSTLRGNVGIELRAVMEELACDKIVVAPAFPAAGRATLNGTMLVNGARVTDTQFARDPSAPAREAYIPRLLEPSTRCQVGLVSLEVVNAGAEAIYRAIDRMPQKVVVCDAVLQSHLAAIARAAALSGGRWLLCGSAGLARELTVLLDNEFRGSVRRPTSGNCWPALAVVGSLNRVAAEQLLRAKDEVRLPALNLDIECLGRGDIVSEVERLVREATGFLARGKTVAITSTFSQYDPTARRLVAPAMAEAVSAILASHRLGGLFLSGGDIAEAVC